MRSRTLLTILLLIISLGWPVLVRAQEDGATLTVEDATGNPDSAAKVTVSISNASGIGALDLALRYDPDVVRFAQVQVGASAENALVEANEVEPGLLLVALADSDGLSSDGPVVVVEFDVVGSEGDRTTMAVETARAYHYDTLIDIPLATTDGELTVVVRAMPTPVPSPGLCPVPICGGTTFVALIVPVMVMEWLLVRRRRATPVPTKVAPTGLPGIMPTTEALRFCLQCGKPVKEGIGFCTNCGANLQ